MRINHNVPALNTYRQLSTNTANQSKSIEKLSSGLRINRAGDDAAGLAISEKMRGQIRGLDQASRNAQDGISLIQTAEGALNESHDILQRMRELAVQSSNGTNTDTDRVAIQSEMNQLTSEINRIGNTTEFNTQSLLKGTNAKAVTTAAGNTTVAAGQTGVAAGALSALTTAAKSVVGVSSSATVQAGTSAATGSISNFAVTAPSTAAVKGTVTVANGISFQEATGGALNGKTVEIVQGAASSTSTAVQNGDKYTITIGADASGNSLATNRGELYNEISNGLKAGSGTVASPSNPITAFTVNVPTSTNTALSSIATSGTFSGGVAEALGAYTFDVSQFKEAGDTIDIGGTKFTAVFGTPTTGSHEFSIGTDEIVANRATAASVATSLKAAIANDAALTARFGAATGTSPNIILTEQSGKATGVNLTAPIVAGGGTNDKLTITNSGGQNLKTVNVVQGGTAAGAKSTSTAYASFTAAAGSNGTELNGVQVKFSVNTAAATSALTSSWDTATQTLTLSGTLNTADNAAAQSTSLRTAIGTGLTSAGFTSAGTMTGVDLGAAQTTATAINAATLTFGSGATTVVADTLKVDSQGGNLTVYLANATEGNNTAAKIEAAIKALGNVGGNDFSKYTAQGSGSWDTGTLGNDLTKGTSTLVGGTQEVKGNYKLTIDKAFAAGDNVVIKGQVFKAVESGADSTKGEFNVIAGNTAAQASSLIDALNLNSTLSGTYLASATGSTVSLTEHNATGTDLKTSDLKVSATGVNGQYTVDTSQLMTDGASITVDGQKISVSDNQTHVGYGNGTAIKAAGSAAQQTQALSDAINKNASLNQLYTASVASDGKLQLDQKVGNTTAPKVEMTTSTKGDFSTSFQVGANSGQSMNIGVKDMRAEALGISGDGSASSVAAKDGSVASYVSVANITDGTSTTNTEFSLDVSSSEKASAAVSVLNDAIESVSAQRSQLGAYQNRLEHTINNLNTSSENLTSAESRIRDVDMAKEMMNQTKNSILAQAAQAMLAQANQQPQGVLQLLRG